MKSRDSLLMIDYYFDHNFEKVVKELNNKEHPEIFEDKKFNKEFKKEMSSLKKRGVKTLTILDDNYPYEFKNIYKPPLVLFYTGDINILKDAIANKNYDYLTGPNKFELDPDKLVTSKFNIISFGDNKFNIWTDRSPFILRIIPSVTKNVICTRKLKETDSFLEIVAQTCMEHFGMERFGNSIFIVPTLELSLNNDLINDGACLLDSKGRIL